MATWKLNINPQLYIDLLQGTSSNIISEKLDLKWKQIHDLIRLDSNNNKIILRKSNQLHMGNTLYLI